MKGSVITSIVLHGLVLAWLLISLGAATPMEVTAGEALPVELITDASQLQEGDKQAPKKEEASKEKTTREAKLENALNSGDNDFDLKSVPTPIDRPSNVEKAATAEKTDDVAQHDTEVQKSQDNVKEDTAADPSTDDTADSVPAADVTPEPRPDVKKAEDKPVEEAKLEPTPDDVPVPMERPKVEEKKVEEKKPDEKKTEEKKQEKKDVKVTEAKSDKDKKAKKDKETKKAKKTTTNKDSDFTSKETEIAELLNKVDNNPGGARRSIKEKSQGAETPNSTAAKLSQSEMDALKGMIEKNWSIMPGTETNGVVITVKFHLDQNGEIVGDPEVKGTGGDADSLQVLEGGALRAVQRSAPFDQLPKDKYDTWKVVTVNFSPSDIM